MSNKKAINTPAAPTAIGPYSQAIQADQLVFLSGQIPLDPVSMELIGGDIVMQSRQVLENLSAVAKAAGGSLEDIVKLTIYLTDLENFSSVNSTMAAYFSKPYPARATVQVSALPKGAEVEIDGVMLLSSTKQKVITDENLAAEAVNTV